jgi:uncharacterized protein
MTVDLRAQSSVLPNSANAPTRKLGARIQGKRLLALCLGCFCVGLGAIGAVLPLIPSTPFFLCAAGCFARIHPRLEAWLLSFVGGPVRAWRERGAIALPAKVTATAGMSFSLAAYAMSGASAWALAAAAATLALCAIFIWTRPS